MKKALSALTYKGKRLMQFHIEDKDWFSLTLWRKDSLIVTLLSKSLCGDQYATLHVVRTGANIMLDSLDELYHHLDTKPDRNTIDASVLLALQEGRDKLLKHYRLANWIYCALLILDRRHKLETFDMSQWGKELKKGSCSKVERIFRTVPANPCNFV